MGKRIMIVEDSIVTRLKLRDILETGGHRVIAEAANGEESLAKYIDLRPDLVFMDIVLPHKNGIEAAGDILSIDKNAAIVMISVLNDIPLIQASFTIGAKDFVQKPFQPGKILSIVQNMCAHA